MSEVNYRKYLKRRIDEEINSLLELLVKEKKLESIYELQGKIVGLKLTLVFMAEIEEHFRKMFEPNYEL